LPHYDRIFNTLELDSKGGLSGGYIFGQALERTRPARRRRAVACRAGSRHADARLRDVTKISSALQLPPSSGLLIGEHGRDGDSDSRRRDADELRKRGCVVGRVKLGQREGNDRVPINAIAERLARRERRRRRRRRRRGWQR